jgi:hypothetical protein
MRMEDNFMKEGSDRRTEKFSLPANPMQILPLNNLNSGFIIVPNCKFDLGMKNLLKNI